MFAPIGPVSSIHDRACELFYALRGGIVDYGAEHSKKHGHARFGRQYDEPLCPSWGSISKSGAKRLPAHFLGHSLGGPTILKLQQLLRQGFFDEALGIRRSTDEADGDQWRAEDLILSVTSVSSPFRGTPLVYSLGSEPLPYPKVRMFSFGDMLSKFIHIAAFLDLPFFDAHADAWHFSAKRRKAVKRTQLPGGATAAEKSREADTEAALERLGDNEEVASGVRALLRQLWRSDWAGGRDCAPWDCTFAERDNDRSEDGWGLDQNPCRRRGKTWYRSYAGGMTVPERPTSVSSSSMTEDIGPSFHRPETYWSLSPLTLTAHLIGHFDYSRLQPRPSFLPELPPIGDDAKDEKDPRAVMLGSLSSAWWENDGVVPLASQFHPFDCHSDRCRHFTSMPASLPFGKRRKRLESTDLKHKPSITPSTPLSPASETATLVDVELPSQTDKKAEEREESLLPLPATHRRKQGDRSMLGSAKSAARIAYFTSLRAINVHEPPLVTPSDEELRSFLPDLTPSDLPPVTEASPNSSPLLGTRDLETAVEEELVEPKDNKWYTFEIENLDHTSLCPFWTGSEVQKQFWTGIGFFLASVDRKAGYTVVDSAART